MWMLGHSNVFLRSADLDRSCLDQILLLPLIVEPEPVIEVCSRMLDMGAQFVGFQDHVHLIGMNPFFVDSVLKLEELAEGIKKNLLFFLHWQQYCLTIFSM